MTEPSHMSLPRAAALPVLKMGFSYAAKQRLLANGIVSALQLAEIASRAPQQLRHLTGISGTKARRILAEELGILPDFTQTAASFEPVPAPGVPEGLPAALSGQRHGVRQAAEDRLIARLNTITDRPTRISLTHKMQPIGNQGPFGTCVGWAANAVREYALGREMSPGYAYRGAKSRDGHNSEGSWLFYAMEHFFQTGHVRERDYPYARAIRDEPIDILAGSAAHGRSIGHTYLLRPNNMGRFPDLMRALLAGSLNPAIGPVPIAVSLRLYQSFISTATTLDGLIPMPLPKDELRGGHAMCVVGYVDADDPGNPFGISYFLVRNSWGTTWAAENPFGEPGHAMIPERYFMTKNYVSEAYICLGGRA